MVADANERTNSFLKKTKKLPTDGWDLGHGSSGVPDNRGTMQGRVDGPVGGLFRVFWQYLFFF
jgi:hypothetical protein